MRPTSPEHLANPPRRKSTTTATTEIVRSHFDIPFSKQVVKNSGVKNRVNEATAPTDLWRAASQGPPGGFIPGLHARQPLCWQTRSASIPSNRAPCPQSQWLGFTLT